MISSNQDARTARLCRTARVIACSLAALLLPPFLALAVAPMLLLLVPVAMVGIPFLIPALLRGSLAVVAERRQARLQPHVRLRLVPVIGSMEE